MSITAKELAKKLNLSESAISIALNNKSGVSTATRKRILEAAKKYGYDLTRHTSIAPLSCNGTLYFVIYRKHGAVVADTPFFTQLSEGIAKKCKESGYYLNIRYMYEDDFHIDLFNEWKLLGCKGMVLLGTEMEKQDVKPFISSGIPLVILDNYFDTLELDCVLINNMQGAFLATDYLIRKCHSQPGYLHSSYSINNFEERADGFYKAIRRNGMSTKRSVVHSLTPSTEGAYEDMKAIIEQGETLAQCYFADNDLIAAGAMRALKEAGYRIPQDISIVGFDDMPLCTYMEPTLSTVYVPKEEMGKTAIQRLVTKINEGTTCSPMKIEMGTSLKKRKSVK